MKIIKLIIAGFIVVFTVSGCSYKGEFKPELVTKNADFNKSKVDKKVVIIDHYNKTIEKRPRTFRGSANTISMETASIGDGVSKLFMEQYFNDVSMGGSRNKSFIEMNVEVLDYNYNFGMISDSVEMDIELQVDVKQNDELVLSKRYFEDVSNSNLASLAWLKGDLTLYGQGIETFHKGVFYILEEKVKPDLIKALKKRE